MTRALFMVLGLCIGGILAVLADTPAPRASHPSPLATWEGR